MKENNQKEIPLTEFSTESILFCLGFQLSFFLNSFSKTKKKILLFFLG